ncbi:MAG: glycosyltransferase [Candidatus Altiarchaeota archaeon]
MDVSVGVCAYNEERNIARLLDAVLKQKVGRDRISEILVISSGSTDRTESIVGEYAKKDGRIRLLIQKKKEGKASAINLFLREARGDLFILLSADLIPSDTAFRFLCEPFENPAVGLTTGRPVPDNNPDSFMGYTVRLVWELHHRLQLRMPKANEMLAMKPLVERIDVDTAVDDLQIEALIKKRGYLVVYVPDAVVVNHGPETVADLIRQRKRIMVGYLHTKESKDYYPITMDKIQVLSALLETISFRPKRFVWTFMAVILEAYIRLGANIDYYVLKRNPYNWETSESTKKLG